MYGLKPLAEWEHDESGGLAFVRLLTFGSIAVSSGGAVLRLEYAETDHDAVEIQAGRKPPSYLQVGLTLAQLDSLADILEERARKVRAHMKPN